VLKVKQASHVNKDGHRGSGDDDREREVKRQCDGERAGRMDVAVSMDCAALLLALR
jgi:hypothetical protein